MATEPLPVFVPFALEMAEAEATYVAIRTVFESGSMAGASPTVLQPLAGAMLKVAEAIDAKQDAARRAGEGNG